MFHKFFKPKPTIKLQLAWILVIVLMIIDFLVISHYAIGRYQTYHALAFDLGNMDQSVWNTLHGHPFRFTNRGEDWQGPPTRLAAHVEPIIILIAPFYLIYSGPQTLIILQTVAIVIGAIPLFLIARKKLPSMPFVGVSFVTAYLLAPELLGESLFDFHPVALATPLLLFALLTLVRKQYIWFVTTAVLAAMCKEEVALSLIPLGIYIIFWHKKRILGTCVALISLIWVVTCFLIIIPHYDGNIFGNYTYRYEWIGDPTSDVANDITNTPIGLLKNIDTPLKQKYLTILLRTGGGLSILSPLLLVSALPEIGINILSDKWEQYIGLYQYNAVIIPFIMVASVFGAAELYKAKSNTNLIKKPITLYNYWQKTIMFLPIPKQLIASFIIFCLAIATVLNITTLRDGLVLFLQTDNQPRPDQAQINNLLTEIPATASVATTPTLNAHLSDRYTIFLLPDRQSYGAEYIAIDNADTQEMKQPEVKQMVQNMIHSPQYQRIGTAGQVTILKHRTNP